MGLISEARDGFDLLNKTSVKRNSERKPTLVKCRITLKAKSKFMFQEKRLGQNSYKRIKNTKYNWMIEWGSNESIPYIKMVKVNNIEERKRANTSLDV